MPDPPATNTSEGTATGKKKKSALRIDVLKNTKAIEKLKDVPDKLDQLLKMISNSDEMVTEPEEVESVDDEDTDPIMNLIRKTAQHETGKSQEDPNLLTALNVMQPEPEYGEPLNNDVAKSIGDLFKKDAKNAREKFKEKFKVPENCKALEVPRVNPEIWSMLPPQVKQRDYSVQQQQQLVSLAAVAVASMTNTLFCTKEPINQALRQELIVKCMEASSVLAVASEDFNRQRKLAIKPALNREYESICNTSKTAEGLLFGDNVLEQLKATKSSSQLVRSASRGVFRGSTRFRPYNRPLNLQSPLNRGRGAFRQYRSRQNYASRPYRPYQNLRGARN